MSKLLIGVLVVLAIFIGVAAIYAIGGLIFMACWNWLVPALWHTAPHLSWKAGVAVAWLIGVLQSIFGRTVKTAS